MSFFSPSNKPRSFSYDPRHYDPSKEKELRRRLHVRRKMRSSRRSPTHLFYLALLLGFAIYLYQSLGA